MDYFKIKKEYKDNFWGNNEISVILHHITLTHLLGKDWLNWGLDTIKQTLKKV